MQFKEYIDGFKEINDLPREQQFVLLEQAHEQVYQGGFFNPMSLVHTFTPIVMIAICVSLAAWLIGTAAYVLIPAGAVGLLLARVIIKETYTKRLHTALISHLATSLNTEHGIQKRR